MLGPEILARTMSAARERGGSTSSEWQYHSRSDLHSKVACWTLLLDLLAACEPFQEDAKAGRLGFRINCLMVGPINKTLDLVVTRAGAQRAPGHRRTFRDLAAIYGIVLDGRAERLLDTLPSLEEDRVDEVSETALAIEAKACMTEHVKSLPRLHAEILATGYLAKRAAPHCITAAYVMVNSSDSFRSPGAVERFNLHRQPEVSRRIIDMLASAIPRAEAANSYGYDAIGVTSIMCRNDGSPVTVDSRPVVSASLQEHVHYEQMIASLCSAYRRAFRR